MSEMNTNDNNVADQVVPSQFENDVHDSNDEDNKENVRQIKQICGENIIIKKVFYNHLTFVTVCHI